MHRNKKKDQPGRNTQAVRSSGSPVFSYHANRTYRANDASRDSVGAQEPKRSRRYSIKKRIQHIFAFGFAVAILIAILNLSGRPDVVVVGSKNQVFLRDSKVYSQAAAAMFSSPLNKNKLTINSSNIENSMLAQFPELQTVVVSLPVFGSTPKVYVNPSVPKIILVSKNSMFVLNGDGRALIAGNDVAKLSSLGLPAVADQSGVDVKLGKVAIPKSYAVFIAEMYGQLTAAGVKIASITLPPVATEMDVHIDGAGYTIKFNLQGDGREEAGSFLAMRKYFTDNNKAPAEYVDVRVQGKAYYR